MKKFILQVSITPNDNDVTLEGIKKAMGHLGSVCFTVADEIEVVDTSGLELPREAWIYISADDSEPYVIVAARGETEGEEIKPEELEDFKRNGVCIKFYAEYPRAEKYGAPRYSADDEFAEAVVSEHEFRVSLDLNVYSEDRGDDGSEQIWLKIALPQFETVAAE